MDCPLGLYNLRTKQLKLGKDNSLDKGVAGAIRSKHSAVWRWVPWPGKGNLCGALTMATEPLIVPLKSS